MMKVLLFVVLITSVYCQPCSVQESVNITNGELLPNGSVFWDGTEYTDSLWYELEADEVKSRMGCPCIGRTCVWKCCGDGEVFTPGIKCHASDVSAVNPFSPPLYKASVPVETVAHDHFFYMYAHFKLNCKELYMIDSASKDQFYIQENGTLYEVTHGRQAWHAPHHYCVEMLALNSTEARLFATVCYPETVETEDSPFLHIAYGLGLLISVPYLLATFLVYALIPELRNLHGMCLMAYCAGLVVAYTFLAYLKLQIGSSGLSYTGCLTIAIIIYYAFQSSFFWLNVMCFDIWRTFSGYRGSGSNARRERRRFAMYGAYAWGMPAALTACVLAMQFADLPEGIIGPGLGVRKCWFEDWTSNFLYFFIPVLVLVACNVVLFSVTAHRIRSIRQETAILKGSDSARSDKLKKDKQRYGLYLKLFIVMGVNWSVELISFMVGGSDWYWILTDLANVGLGFYIVYIFVWKKKVRNLIVKRFRTMFGLAAPAPDMRKSPWTSSSHTEDTRVSASADDPSIRLKSDAMPMT